jgi:hypothetical protein
MKTFKIFMLLFCLTLFGCEKNFDPKIYGVLFSSNFPKTEADYQSLLLTLYSPYSNHWSYTMGASGTYGLYIAQGVYMYFDLPSDCSGPELGHKWYRASVGDFRDFVLDPSGDDNPNIRKLRDISICTQTIGTIEAANENALSPNKKKNFLGEARLLRGLLLYYVFHVYGPVPAILDPALVGDPDAESNLVRPKLEEIAKWIADDLEFAVQNMANTQSEQGRYTADYARVCLMRHYLNEGSYMPGYYDKAIELYNQLKLTGKYELYTSGENPYAEQFMLAHKFNKEVIMSVSCGPGGTGDAATGNFNPLTWYLVPADAARYADPENTIPTPFVNQGGGWGQHFNISPDYYDTFEDGDLRKETIVTEYHRNDANRTLVTREDVGVRWYGYIINKYPIEVNAAFQETDIPLARWADVLLMYAEAVARKNKAVPTGEALDGVNAVRARAGLKPLGDAVLASYDAFMDALLAERGWEFHYEGFRKIDQIRFNKFRHNNKIIKGIAPTLQYLPLPNYFVNNAKIAGHDIEQYYNRPDWEHDQ